MVRIAIDVKVDPKDGRTYFTGALLARLDGSKGPKVAVETSTANKVLQNAMQFVGSLTGDVRQENREVQ